MTMLEPTKGLPSHIALLLNEDFPLGDFARTARKLREMVRDLKNQAEVASYDIAADLRSSETDFRAVLSGGLDLFSGDGACQEPLCRVGYAEQIARSIMLMADQVSVHDFFQERILALSSKPTNSELFQLVADLHVLKVLQPAIEVGIVRFISPLLPACSHCMEEFNERVEKLADRLLSGYKSEIKIRRKERNVAIDMASFYDPPIFFI